MPNRFALQGMKRQMEQLYISNAELNKRLKETEASLSDSLGREAQLRLSLTLCRESLEDCLEGNNKAVFYLAQLMHYVKKERITYPSASLALLKRVEEFLNSLDDDVVLDDFNLLN